MAPPQDGLSLHDADAKYKVALERLVHAQGTVAFKFGSMYLTLPTVRVMFVFTKEDAQYEALKWAAEKMHYACSLSTTAEEAVENFFNGRPHLVFIDARGKGTMDPTALCRTLRGNRGSQFSCIVAVVKKALADKEDAAIVPLLKYGFSRWLTETCSHGVCLNEMIQIEHNDLANLRKLEASEALFSALHFTRDGVIVTGPSHDIQFMNHAAERLVGYTAEELLGENAQELHRTGALKAERRRSGECVPVWSKIAPVDISGPGKLDHMVYVKESPFLMDRPFSPDAAGSNKRQAYAAKYHAMTIEGPVTKVVNMLMATKDNCAASVGQSLDRVIDILKSTELYNPQLSASMGKAEDQMTSDLVAGLTSTGQKPTGVRRLSHETALMKVNVVKATSSTTAATHGCLSPSLAAAPTKIRELLENDVKWDFDIIELESHTARRPLIWLGMSVFAKFSVHTSLECDDTIISNWLQLIESHYQDNPYHNSTHAADVMQATAYFLLRLRNKDIFDPLDEAICLLSAVIHDVDHPGRSTPFLCNSQDPLAILYNDRSVLEFHHAALGFKLTLSDEKVNVFQNMERDVYRTVRASIIDMVLATEMTKHFEHLSKFLNAFQKPAQDDDAFGPESTQDQGEFGSLRSPESIVLIKRMLIKCADVSNPARPIELCKQWAQRIAEEYCSQTDEEKRRGLPVMMPAFDRATVNIAKSQTGFISYFVRDMFKAWSDFGDFPEILEIIEKNFIYWKDKEPPPPQ
ncbi:hypothetical protein MTO96_015388 [Rhipicephalus appendiculatus]